MYIYNIKTQQQICKLNRHNFCPTVQYLYIVHISIINHQTLMMRSMYNSRSLLSERAFQYILSMQCCGTWALLYGTQTLLLLGKGAPRLSAFSTRFSFSMNITVAAAYSTGPKKTLFARDIYCAQFGQRHYHQKCTE